MKGLRLSFNGEIRIFRPDGAVAVMVDGQPIVKGRWRSQALAGEPRDNQLRYDFDGVAQEPVAVRYRFNPTNQLEMTLPASVNGGVDSPPFTLIGRIVIDDQHDVVYQLIDSEGNDFPRKLVLYGDLEINDKADQLVVHLAGPLGGKAVIKGQRANLHTTSAVEAAHNDVLDFPGEDLLWFNAITRNPVDSGMGVLIKRADIALVGAWDLREGQVVFSSKVRSNPDKPDVVIGLAGKFKGVSGGLAYVAVKESEAGPQERLLFQVAGRHQWEPSDARWNLTLGYSQKKLAAIVEGELTRKNQDGRQLKIGGKVKIASQDGSAVELDCELTAAYRWRDGVLVVSAAVSATDEELNYDLGLEGRFEYKAGVLSFKARYNSLQDEVGFELGFTGNQANLIQALRLIGKWSEDEVDLAFEFQASMQWRDGVRVISAPRQLAPQA